MEIAVTREVSMTEQPNTPARAGDDEQGPSAGARPVEHAEGGRTSGETAVDEALGSDAPPAD
jgi:hypothetical protein